MVFHGAGLGHRRELIGIVVLFVIFSSGMSTTIAPTSEPPSTAQDMTTDEEPTSTMQPWSFPKLGGSITMIFAAILGSVLTSWIARRACPDAWTGQYCESCTTYLKGQKRRKRAIVLPTDEDPTLRWTVGPGPNPITTPPQQPPDISSQELVKNGGNSIDSEAKPKPKAKPSFMTISSLVSNFTVPRTDLTAIALEQIKTDKEDSSKKHADKEKSKESKTTKVSEDEDEDGVGVTKNSKESLTEDDSSLANGATVNKAEKGSVGEQEEISYDENEPLKQTQVKQVIVETHASPSDRYSNTEIMDPREAAKLDSPSQRSETYSSDFESMTTHMTHESGLYSESPIRTIYEEVRS